MVTPVETLWTILKKNMPHGQWLHITELYNIVERNFTDFTKDDLSPVTGYNNEPT